MDYIYFTDTDVRTISQCDMTITILTERYLQRVIVRTADGKVWASENDGASWKELFPGANVVAVYQNTHHEDRVRIHAHSSLLIRLESDNDVLRHTSLRMVSFTM